MKKKLLFLLLISISSFAQIQRGNVSYFVDYSAKKSLQDLILSNPFTPTKNDIPSLGINPNVVWTKVSVKNLLANPQKIYVQIPMPYIDTVQYFVVKNKVFDVKSGKMGWWTAQKKGGSANPNHSYNLILDAHKTVEIYARTIKTHGTVRIPLQIDTEKEFWEEALTKQEFWGWFIGIGFIVIFLNLFLYFSTKEQVYLFYTFYVFCQIFNLASREGIHAELYMGGFLTMSGRNLYYLSMILIVISNILFINSYLRTKELQPKAFYYFTQILIGISLILALILFIPESKMQSITTQKVFTLFFTACYFLSIFFVVVLIFYAIIKDKERKAAIWYLVAGSPLLAVAIIQMLGNIQLLPIRTAYRNNILAMVIAFEIVLLCLWLANRFKAYADERKRLLIERSKQQQIALETGLQLQYQERSRLAKELHDGVGIDISIIKMKLEALGLDLEKRGFRTKEFNDTISNLDNVASDIRSFSHNLMPPDLENNGIVNVLKSLVYNLQKLHPSIEINFTTNIENKLVDDLSQNLYFITKELINNALKYANATIIDIELMQENHQILLKVADNGIGYDFEQAIKKGGLGLKSILSRSKLINAKFEVFEKPSRGVLHQLTKPD
ncbi:MAG: 7TM diverse intracellular signaling domain-containing protein [Spirosomataceae bacterium]